MWQLRKREKPQIHDLACGSQAEPHLCRILWEMYCTSHAKFAAIIKLDSLYPGRTNTDLVSVAVNVFYDDEDLYSRNIGQSSDLFALGKKV
jgi:hypothetical protein